MDYTKRLEALDTLNQFQHYERKMARLRDLCMDPSPEDKLRAHRELKVKQENEREQVLKMIESKYRRSSR